MQYLNLSATPIFLRATLAPTLPWMGNCNFCNSAWCSCSANPSFTGSFSDGGQAEVDALLKRVAANPFLGFLMGKQFSMSNPSSKVTRMTVNFGSPLKGFKNQLDGETGGMGAGKQTKKFETWAKSLKPKLDEAETKYKNSVEVLYFWPLITFQEILNVLLHDGLLALGSVMFVGVYLHIHTGSSFLAATGMFHIFMSFGLGFFIYRIVFGIIPFYTLSFLSIYVVLAIGADDVFVFIDAWKQSASAGPEVNKNVVTRMSWVYRRAVKAMFVTSLTTFGAFAATAISPLNDVATFGLFTATLVAANYLFVITWFPCCVLVYHRYFESRPGCCCCLRAAKRKRLPFPYDGVGASAQQAGAAEEDGAQGEDAEVPEGKVERFFRTKYVPMLGNKKFTMASVTLLVVIGAVFLGLSSQLGPTTKEDQLLPDWHPFQRIVTAFNEDFKSGGDTPNRESDIVWGLDANKPLDRAGLSRYDTGKNNGKLVFDPTFDLSLPSSQLHFLSVCESLTTTSPRIVRASGGDDEVLCIMRGLKQFVLGANAGTVRGFNQTLNVTFPIESSKFVSTLEAFLAYRKNVLPKGSRWPPNLDYEKAVLIDDKATPKKVSFAMIRSNTTIGAWNSNFNDLENNFNWWSAFVSQQNARAGAAMNKAFLSAPTGQQSSAWVFYTTQKILVVGAFTGAAVSGVFAYVILTLSTFNGYLALLAILDIIGIVACILGSMYCMGWQLGVIESVSITVLVGLSVDYVVHLANSFIEAKADDRLGRVGHASVEMGITVFGGAITSLGASFMLFLCYFQFFFKFGCFMFLTIFLSFAWAFLFFLPMAALCGPEGGFGSFAPCARRTGAKLGCGSSRRKVQEVEMQGSH
jgi:hypothetical protein